MKQNFLYPSNATPNFLVRRALPLATRIYSSSYLFSAVWEASDSLCVLVLCLKYPVLFGRQNLTIWDLVSGRWRLGQTVAEIYKACLQFPSHRHIDLSPKATMTLKEEP